MKVAVISDIHANWAALEAVLDHVDRWRPDHVVVAGDVVNRGPEPVRCLETVRDRQRRRGWHVLIGNHEEYVLYHRRPDAPRSGPAFELYRYSYWTYTRLSAEQLMYLNALPFHTTFIAPDGSVLYITHASPQGTRDGIYPETPDEVVRRKVPPDAALMAVGHTHRPLIRRAGACTVVNAGAVGLPFDGDPRASYAQIEWRDGAWQARVVRVAYDRARAVRAFFSTGYVEEAGPLAWLILVELRFARSQLYQWTCRYQRAVLSGRLTMEAAVRAFLAEQHLSPADILRPDL